MYTSIFVEEKKLGSEKGADVCTLPYLQKIEERGKEKGADVSTVPYLQKIEERGKEKGADVSIVPLLDEYSWGRFPMILGLHGQVENKLFVLK